MRADEPRLLPNQPVVYSHAVHAGALKIPCQYCHYGAERGRNAGIPPAAICMNCHAQVQKDHPEVVKVKKALSEGGRSSGSASTAFRISSSSTTRST